MEIMSDTKLETMKDNIQFMSQRFNLSIGEYLREGFNVDLSYEDDSGDVYQVTDITSTTDEIVISYEYYDNSTEDLVIRFDEFNSYEEFDAYFKKHVYLIVSKIIDY